MDAFTYTQEIKSDLPATLNQPEGNILTIPVYLQLMDKIFKIKSDHMKLLILLLMAVIFSSSCEKDKNPVTPVPDVKNDLTIKSSIITPSFVGNGAQWGGYDILQAWTGSPTLSDADWNTLFGRVRFMRPPLVRVMVTAGWNYTLNGMYNPSKSEAVLVKILDFCQAEGISVMLGEWGHQGGTQIDQAWLENSAKFLEWLINTKQYTCIRYFNMVNEPNGDWSSTNGNYDLWKTLIGQFYTKLTEKGIASKIKIIGPDIAIWDANLTSWVINTNFDLGDKIGAYDIHTYPEETQVREGSYQTMVKAYKNSAPASREMLMAELGFKYAPASALGQQNAQRILKDPFASDDSNMFTYDAFYGIDMADAVVQNMLAGYAGCLLWDLDDAMYNIDGGGSTKLKRWGFWNTLGSEKFDNPADENIRPWFYPMSLMCRYFPQGTKIFDVALPDKKGLRAVAGEKDGKFTIAIVNSNFTSYDINLKMENGALLSAINSYRYISGNGASFTGKTDTNGFASPDETNITIDFKTGSSKKISVPAQSFLLFTNMD